MTKDQLTTEEAERAADKHYETLKSRTRRFREEMTAFGVLGFGQHEDKPVCWWTGKPLRAFPHTQPPPEKDDDPSTAIPF